MKNTLFIISALVALALTSCVSGEDIGFDDDWDAPKGEVPFGNNALMETNVMSIQDLKNTYLSQVTNANDTVAIHEDVQIKGIVTANDIEGNVYNEICVEDATGGILVCISSGGLYSYLPEGQEILVSLKGLYIGYYGNQAQIGMPYTNKSGKVFPSRMNRSLWQSKFKIIGTADPSRVQPEEFDLSRLKDVDYVRSHSGRVMTVKGIEIAEADGKAVWADEASKDAGNGVNRTLVINGKKNSNTVVRSSTYADFAAEVVPSGKMDITGVFTVYSSNLGKYAPIWQILVRKSSDIQSAN